MMYFKTLFLVYLNIFRYFVFCSRVFNFVIRFSCFIMSLLVSVPLLFLVIFTFYGKIALQSVSDAVKVFATEMLMAKTLLVKILDTLLVLGCIAVSFFSRIWSKYLIGCQ